MTFLLALSALLALVAGAIAAGFLLLMSCGLLASKGKVVRKLN